jgi:hypothetical protein
MGINNILVNPVSKIDYIINKMKQEYQNDYLQIREFPYVIFELRNKLNENMKILKEELDIIIKQKTIEFKSIQDDMKQITYDLKLLKRND